ncbi:MAG: RIP metalloprotease RseP [Lachnospiraceae bacterium]
MPSIVGTIISFILIFTVVVVSHEFGHFLIGWLNGIKVNEFSIGMGPAIFKKKLKSFVLSIRLFPIGGACIFEGEVGNLPSDEEDEEEEKNNAGEIIDGDAIADIGPNTHTIQGDEADDVMPEEANNKPFNKAPVWGRFATVFAGPLFNIILAYLFSLFICWFCGQDIPVISQVTEGMPAAEAGIQVGDMITEINGQKICVWREISVISMMNNGSDISISYERDGREYETVIHPYYSEEEDRYYMGLAGGNEIVPCNNISVFKYSWYEVRYWLITTVRSLVYMVSGNASADDIAGPVGVATVIDDTIEQTSQYGLFTVILNMINIAVLLSVNLGVLNLLPLPALDGGRLIFLLLEAVRGKPVSAEKEGIVHLIGFVLLMLLMIFVFFNDIMRLFR